MIPRRLAISIAAAVLSVVANAPLAHAEFGFQPGYVAVLSSIQAGAHGDLSLSFTYNSHPDPLVTESPDDTAKTLIADLPPGVVGDPQAVPHCSAEFLRANTYCPADTQVGVIRYTLTVPTELPTTVAAPIYNMVAQNGRVAELGFQNEFGVTPQIHMLASVRTGEDYGISTEIVRLPGELGILDSSVQIWGVPAAHGHDEERGSFTDPAGGCLGLRGESLGSCPFHGLPRPFLSNPTRCDHPDSIKLSIDSYQNPGNFLDYFGEPQQMEGCDKLEFHPFITFQPTSHEADSPTGLEIDLSVPQNEDPKRLATANLKKSVTVLPKGMTVNPAAGDGLTGCSEEEIGLHNAGPDSCPDSSKIGTVEIESNMLPKPLKGFAYQAKQGANPFGSTLAFYTSTEGSGMRVKLAAKVTADPQTGQVTTTFDDNPQLAFTHFKLHFFEGPHAPLVNPPTCGTYTGSGEFVPWSAKDPQNPAPSEVVNTEDSFQITSGPNGTPCPNGLAGRPFAPKLEGGLVSPIAGSTSPFVMRLTREDGEQRLAGLSVTPPAGVAAYLKGVSYCSEAQLASVSAALGTGIGQIASPSCPAASQVGTVVAGTGAGPIPLYLQTGRVYLAGPYKGAPLSLAIVVPAVAGPLDLGSVLTRAAVQVDPSTAQLTVVSDPLPQSIAGIPLDIRDLRVNIDRPGFAVAPTSCEPTSFGAHVTGSDGAVADPRQRFQVADCAALAFKPKLALRLKGQTKRSGNPSLRATLTMPKRPGANVARASVSLPHSEFLDQAHIRTVCTRVQYAAGGGGGAGCPKGSVYGYARAFSPLLEAPLEGPVYLRSNGGERPLPDLVASLGGQIHVDLLGTVGTDKRTGGLRNTFAVVPDAPVSKFTLTLQGGSKGLLENSADICRGSHRAIVDFTAHSGKVAELRPPLRGDCGGGGKGPRRHGR